MDAGQRSNRWRARAALAALAALTSALGLGGGFVWDDLPLIAHHPLVRGSAPLLQAWVSPLLESDPAGHVYYRPLVSFVFALWGWLWGVAPLPYHVLSWLLHLAVVWASVGFLQRRAPGPEGAERTPWPVWVAGAWLVLHPTRTQSVAWATGAFDLWMSLFALGAARCVDASSPRLRHALGALLATTLALWSKESAVAVPLWLAIDVALRQGTAGLRRKRAVLTASLLGAALALAVRSFFTRAPAVGPLDDGLLALATRALVSLGFLLWRVVWPFDLTVQREGVLGDPASLPLPLAALGLLGLLALAGTAALCLRALRRPNLRPWLADVLGFLVLVAPTLNVVVIGQRGGSLGERYLYLPLLPLGSLLAHALARVPTARRRLALACSGALGLALLLQYQVEQGRFVSDRVFFDSLLGADPSSLFAYDHAISFAVEDGAYDRARTLAAQRARLALRRPPGRTLLASQRPAPDEPARARALLRYAHTEASLVSDANQARLAELRAYVDALLEGRPEAQLAVAGRPYRVTPRPAVLTGPGRAQLHEDAWLLRIRLHARTLDLRRATRWAARPATLGATSAQRERLRARLALWTSDVAAAQAHAGEPSGRAVRGYSVLLRDLRAALERGDRLAEARVVAGAGLPARARVLAKAAGASPVQLAEIDLFDGRPDLALTHLRHAEAGSRSRALRARAQTILERGLRLRR